MVKIKINNQTITVTTTDDLMAELYKDQLQYVANELANEAQKKEHQNIKKALLDTGILVELAEILDEYVAIGVNADLQFSPLTKTVRNAQNDPSQYAGQGLRLNNQALSKCQAYLRFAPDPAPPADLQTIFGNPFQLQNRNPQPREGAEAYQKYFDWFVTEDVIQGGTQKPGVAAFYERYPIIRHAVETSAQNFRKNIISACENICNDWSLIFDIFIKDQSSFKAEDKMRLVKLLPTGSDFHKGGKQVLILTFRDSNSDKTKKLVYKPADIELDFRLVGDTSFLSTAKNVAYLGQSQSLMEVINGFFPESDPARLPTYRILPRKPGSGLSQDGKGNIPIQDSYGYIEFLSHEPQTSPSGAPILPASSGKPTKYDWVVNVKDKETAQRFYRQWGRLLAIASLFSLSDLHRGNVIVHDCQPYLIDLEVSFTGPLAGLNSTIAMDGLWMKKQSAISGKRNRINERTPQLTIEVKAKPSDEPTQNRLWAMDGDTPRMIEPDSSEISQGLVETLMKISQKSTALLSWFENVKLSIGRFIPYATGQFATNLRMFYSVIGCVYTPDDPTFLKPDSSATRQAFKTWIDETLNLWQNQAKTGWPSPRPNFAIQTSEHNFTDYLNCDIPSYYHRINEKDLLNARGERVDIKASKPNPVPNRDSYFPESTWDIVKRQLEDVAARPADRLLECTRDLESWFTAPGNVAALQ